MALDQKRYERKHEAILRDVRPLSVRMSSALQQSSYSSGIFMIAAGTIYINEWAQTFADLILVILCFYFWWLATRDRSLAFKLPKNSKYLDSNAGRKGTKGKAEGILYLGNVDRTNEEVWFSNSDARTHILYLGTTGAGKTEGLKSLVTNAMTWGSGFVYVDGKADTDLWSSLSSLVRRFGRDDDLLVLNYMTGNADIQAPSNTMNPFSSGSASYLTNMLVSLMPQSGGDNAMWKERAVSLVGAMMPVLTWKRDNQDIPMSVRTIREYLSLNNVIKLSRDEAVPKNIRAGMIGYLDTLPGFIGAAYDDNGQVKPPGPDTPQYNTETASQQHGYLAMQFTRSLQSLGDDYGYIFDTQAADVDMTDVVLNRRILVVLVPALEKSGDEVANLGKIVAASIKGMMGSTLGSNVEGSSETVIENKPTHSGTPFMTVFDEVGYYVAEGMAVMAAQARSLGFCLVFSGQDLPALKKRVREEANSITANCNIKIFGKLEDPTETKEFFEKTVGSAMVTEVSGFQMNQTGESASYMDTRQASVQLRPRASYDALRGFKEGQAVITYGETVVDCSIFYSNPGFAKAMRVTRYVSLPPPDENMVKHANAITKLRDLMVNKTWTALRADVAVETPIEIVALNEGFKKGIKPGVDLIDAGIAALIQIHAIDNDVPAPSGETVASEKSSSDESGGAGGGGSSGGGPVLRDRIPPTIETPPVGASPFAGFKAPSAPASENPPLTAQRPVDIVSAVPLTPVQPAENTAQASAKPSIFGAPKTEPATPSPTQQAESAAPQAAKPSIFGAAKPSTTPAPELQQIQSETPPVAKPAIFGAAKPVSAPEAAPQQTPYTPPTEAPQIAKPAIFSGTKPAAPVTPPSENLSQPVQPPAKPAIFGGAKPAASPATEDADAEALRKAAEEAKKGLFGGNGDETKGS